MGTKALNNKKKNMHLISAVLLAIYVVWETIAMLSDYADISNLCPSPLLSISVAAISILMFMKKSGAILIIPFGLMALTFIVNIYLIATSTYHAYFPLGDSAFANAMRFEYFCNIFIVIIDFAISANIILLLLSNTRLFSTKSNKSLSKYALLSLVIVRILIFLLYYLPPASLMYMRFGYATYFLLTPFIYYFGLLFCGLHIADTHKSSADDIKNEEI